MVVVFILTISHRGNAPKRLQRIHSLNRMAKIVFTVTSTNSPAGNQQIQTP